eukprot:GHVS01107008.1.p1 GENE.GHVS01107008.1~~GHVS01107008.1.p1  ORF type:complete len:115 (-),score=8.98 GHVS01107008.1:489-833(-)
MEARPDTWLRADECSSHHTAQTFSKLGKPPWCNNATGQQQFTPGLTGKVDLYWRYRLYVEKCSTADLYWRYRLNVEKCSTAISLIVVLPLVTKGRGRRLQHWALFGSIPAVCNC